MGCDLLAAVRVELGLNLEYSVLPIPGAVIKEVVSFVPWSYHSCSYWRWLLRWKWVAP